MYLLKNSERVSHSFKFLIRLTKVKLVFNRYVFDIVMDYFGMFSGCASPSDLSEKSAPLEAPLARNLDEKGAIYRPCRVLTHATNIEPIRNAMAGN